MKASFQKIHQKMTSSDKLYGTTIMGSRGQVVIPAQARKDLKLQPGDSLIVMGKFGKALGLVKANELEQLVKIIMNNLSGTGMEKKIKERVDKILEQNNFNQ